MTKSFFIQKGHLPCLNASVHIQHILAVYFSCNNVKSYQTLEATQACHIFSAYISLKVIFFQLSLASFFFFLPAAVARLRPLRLSKRDQDAI